MGVTFSFPMQQSPLSQAILMSMGKEFAITSDLDLGGHLAAGYQKHRIADLPPARVAAIANGAVAILVSFIDQFPSQLDQKAAMTLIAAISAEGSIRGSAPPLRQLGLSSKRDTELDGAGKVLGFQPLEYMRAGRCLGELAPNYARDSASLRPFWVTSARPGSMKGPMLQQLEKEFSPENASFCWTTELANVLYRIAKAIELRAAAIVAASIVGLLRCAQALPRPGLERTTLAVG
ncbi:hypothetical protein VTH06DRAFT_4086 [Thermothelomyces fergusii]